MMKKVSHIATAAFIGVSVLGADNFAYAQGLDEILDCRTLSDDGERLRCFDKTTSLAAETIAANGSAANDDGSEIAAASSEANENPDDSFGAIDLVQERSKKEKNDKPKSLRARLVGLSFTNAGKYVITLDNGQVWRQITGDSERLVLSDATGAGVPVIIKQGLFGSHRLRTGDSKRMIRVERIK